MNRQNTGAIYLQLGIACGLLLLSVMAPTRWWSGVPFQERRKPVAKTPLPKDPIAAARRDEADVVPDVLPMDVDPWDELQLLASRPILAGYNTPVAAQANLDRTDTFGDLPNDASVPALPSWDGDSTGAIAGRLASRIHSRRDQSGMVSPSVTPAGPAKSMPLPRKAGEQLSLKQYPWAEMPALLGLFQQLSETASDSRDAQASQWAADVLRCLQMLRSLDQGDSQVDGVLGELARLEVFAVRLATQVQPSLQKPVLIARYAITRRLPAWRLTRKLGDPATRVAMVAPSSSEVLAMPAAIHQLRHWLVEQQATGWDSFLLVDTIEEALEDNALATRVPLVKRIESRIRRIEGPAQKQFVSDDHVSHYVAAARKWAAAVAWDSGLLKDLETAELNDALCQERLALAAHGLQWSDDPDQQRLGRHLATHYRNANVRVSFSEDFLNDWVEDPKPFTQPFRDSILGATVRGRGRVTTQLAVDLTPNAGAWSMLMQAGGTVASDTVAQRGPASLYGGAFSRYVAEKQIWLTTTDVRSSPARAAMTINTRLKGFDTAYDGVPVVGGITRSIVRRQYEKQQARVDAISRQRGASRISEGFDREVQKQLDKSAAELQEEILGPLAKLRLRADAMDMQTSDTRATGRLRLADSRQLGAFTPRPRAPDQSAVDLQVHQSAVNNLLDSLGLQGERATIKEFAAKIAGKFDKTDWKPEDMRPRTQNTIVTFEDREAIRLTADNDVIVITLRLDELDAGRNDFWYDFSVTAIYEPEVEGAQLRFVRRDDIRLDGEEPFSFRDVVVLRGIFDQVFKKDRPLELLDREFAQKDAMQKVAISQCVLSNGWLGIAMTPKSSSESGLAKRPAASPTR